MTLHVAILGGTGHIGKALTAELISDPAVRLQVYVRDMEAMNDHLQKIEAGSSIHLPFNCFDSINMPFYRTITPSHTNSIFDGINILR